MSHPNPKGAKRLFAKMVLFLASVAGSIILFDSCITKSQCDERCNSRIQTKDSVHVSVDSLPPKLVKSDSGFKLIEVPGPVMYLPSPCANLCDSLGHLKKMDVVSHKNGITTEIKSKGDTLSFTAKNDSTKYYRDLYNQTVSVMTQALEERTIMNNHCPETWIQTTYRWSAWFLYFAALLAGGSFVWHLVVNRKV